MGSNGKRINVALITAAGDGTRYGSDIPKQYVRFAGKPLIAWTMQRFESNPMIDGIYVMCRRGDEGKVEGIAKEYGISKLFRTFAGSDTGMKTILYGIGYLLEDLGYRYCNDYHAIPAGAKVVVHDGDRPLVSDRLIGDSLDACEQGSCAITALPCEDTAFLRGPGSDGMGEPIERSRLTITQTPHAFCAYDLWQVYDYACNFSTETPGDFKESMTKDGITLCDIASGLIESEGGTPARRGTKPLRLVAVRGDKANMKVTYPDDGILLERILGGTPCTGDND